MVVYVVYDLISVDVDYPDSDNAVVAICSSMEKANEEVQEYCEFLESKFHEYGEEYVKHTENEEVIHYTLTNSCIKETHEIYYDVKELDKVII